MAMDFLNDIVPDTFTGNDAEEPPAQEASSEEKTEEEPKPEEPQEPAIEATTEEAPEGEVPGPVPYPVFKERNEQLREAQARLRAYDEHLQQHPELVPVFQNPELLRDPRKIAVLYGQPEQQAEQVPDFDALYDDPYEAKMAAIRWENQRETQRMRAELQATKKEIQQFQQSQENQARFFAEVSALKALPEVKGMPRVQQDSLVQELIEFNEQRMKQGKYPLSFDEAYALRNIQQTYKKGVADGAAARTRKVAAPPSVGTGTAGTKLAPARSIDEAVERAFNQVGF